VLSIFVLVDLLFLALALYAPIKDFLFVHQWLLSALAAAPALVIAVLELLHSGEAKLESSKSCFRTGMPRDQICSDSSGPLYR
jgi:hypothetical protein